MNEEIVEKVKELRDALITEKTIIEDLLVLTQELYELQMEFIKELQP